MHGTCSKYVLNYYHYEYDDDKLRNIGVQE